MSDNISDSVWWNIRESVEEGNVTHVVKIYAENGLNYDAIGGDYEETALHIAAERGQHNIVQYFIENDAALDSRDKLGNTPLSVAAINDTVVAARLLLIYGADKDSRNNAGETPLSAAVSTNSTKVAQLLLEHGADKEIRYNNGDTILSVAADNNSLEIAELLLLLGTRVCNEAEGTKLLLLAATKNNIRLVQQLLKQGANVNTKNDAGNTSLAVAALLNNQEVARLLVLGYGANVHIKNNVGDTPFMIAARNDSVEVAELLLEHGAQADNEPGIKLLWTAASGNNVDLVQLLLKQGSDVNYSKDDAGNSLLLLAVREEKVPLAKLILEHGADVNIKNNSGDAPLWIAAHQNNMNLAQLVLKHGANVTYPLLRAIRESNIQIVQLLIELGTDLNIKGYAGATPLSEAVYGNNVEVAQLLLKHGARANNEQGNKLLFAAVREKNMQLIQLLIKQGADVNIKDNGGDTPLLSAVRNINDPLAELTLEHRADVDISDNAGDTPLWIAAKKNDIKLAQLLLKQGADLSVRDRTGMSTLFYIQQNMSTNDLKEIFLNSPQAWTLSDPAAIIEALEVSDEYDNDLKNTLYNLLGQAIEELPSLIDDPKQRFLFYRGNLYSRLITIFLDRGGDDTSLLRTIYIALQAKAKCDQPKKDKKNVLRNELNTVLHKRFHETIELLASRPSLPSKSTDLNIIAAQIYSEYFEEKKNTGLCVKMRKFFRAIVTKLKSCCCRKNGKKRTRADTKKDKKEGEGRCSSLLTEVYHNCTERGKIGVTFCMLGIVFYILDLYTDVVVGIADFKGFSQKLGIFELFLVVFTLCHENYRSSNSVYATRGELLQIELGKFDLETEDWKRTELNWSKNKYIRGFYMFCCPFKVRGTLGLLNTLKAILYNTLTCLQLRPVVDRLVLLLHAPTTLRDYYRRQAEQNCLKQFYLILEQLPELMVQFYTFQIVYNNLSSGEMQNYFDTCYHYFNYHKLNSNNTNETNAFCDNFSLSDGGLRTCGKVFRLFSMAIPFYNIPSGITSLENGFRILDPLTPKMSTALRIIFQASYMLMIPARLFMFAAVMHAVFIKEYIIGYIILRANVELFVNVYSLRKHIVLFNRSPGKKSSTLWRLCLFSIRDVFLISIRDPIAYLSKPSAVSNNSLRNWTNIAVRAIPYICEGLVAAVLIEPRYPCGKHSNFFKYLGWFCLTILVFSLSMIVMVSDLFHPKKIRSSTVNKSLRKPVFIGSISILICGIAALAFFISKSRNFMELLIMGVIIFLNILLNVGLVLFIKTFSTVKEMENDPEKVIESADTHECTASEAGTSESGECAPLLDVPSSNVQSIALDVTVEYINEDAMEGSASEESIEPYIRELMKTSDSTQSIEQDMPEETMSSDEDHNASMTSEYASSSN